SLGAKATMEILLGKKETETLNEAARSETEYATLLQEEKKRILAANEHFRTVIDTKFGESSSGLENRSDREIKEALERAYKSNQQQTLNSFLNVINARLIRNPNDRWAANALSLARSGEKGASAVMKYCLDRFAETLSAKAGYENPDYSGTISLRNVLSKPMLELVVARLLYTET